MAKKSLIAKAKRDTTFSVRKYNRCPLCGVLATIQNVPNLLPEFSLKRRGPGCGKIELVTGVFRNIEKNWLKATETLKYKG
jgi:hypothetical protein